jgi:hypothetical protein
VQVAGFFVVDAELQMPEGYLNKTDWTQLENKGSYILLQIQIDKKFWQLFVLIFAYISMNSLYYLSMMNEI